MRRLRGTGMILAVTLAVLLPIEQETCLAMAGRLAAADCSATSAAFAHGCCCVPRQPSAPTACPCIELPVALPSATAVSIAPPSLPFIAIPRAMPVLAAEPAAAGPVSAPDIGIPDCSYVRDAHPLRAPPLSA